MAFWLQTTLAPEDLTTGSASLVDYIKLLFVLGGILILAYVSIRYLMPRLMRANSGSAGPIQILARFFLEPKKTLYVVKAGSNVFLIGSSESGLQLLKDLDAADFQAQVQEIDTPRSAQFARVLENWRHRKISS